MSVKEHSKDNNTFYNAKEPELILKRNQALFRYLLIDISQKDKTNISGIYVIFTVFASIVHSSEVKINKFILYCSQLALSLHHKTNI